MLCYLSFHFPFLIIYHKSALSFQENQELLIKCISQDLGFFGGRPIAACVIYKCLLHWRSFEVERTGIFDRVIQTVASAIEVSCICGFKRSKPDNWPWFLNLII